jgi:pyrimidine-specific ribonucleoside hydrolase
LPVIPVILDVDTGVDDAMAILLATRSPELDVVGVSCVAGNVDVDQVVCNTLGVLHIAGRDDVPVARGAERPLIEAHRHAGHVHGAHGLGQASARGAVREVEPVHAVLALRDWLLAAADPVTIVALAPLTNIALLLRTFPEVLTRIRRIVFMGGAVACGGNASATAEFNIWHDPEAAAILLQADLPTLMYGLDVFYQTNVNDEQAQALLASADPVANLAGQLLAGQLNLRQETVTTIGDAGAVTALLAPHLLTTALCPTEVDLSAGPSRGQTLVDRRDLQRNRQEGAGRGAAREIEVCLDVDGPAFVNLFLERMHGHV